MNNRNAILLVIILTFIGCSNQKKNSDSTKSLSISANLISSSDNGYPFTSEQLNAVNGLLKDSVHWRLAVDTDNSNNYLADVKKEDSTYKPYLLQTDIDMDGKPDFAIVLIKDSLMAIYWFSKIDSGYSKAKFVAQANWFNECGFYSTTSGYFFFGRFYSDDGVPFQWDTSKKNLIVPEYDNEKSSME